MELSKKLFEDINEDKLSRFIILDFIEAFNTVDYDILMSKLDMY